MRLQVQTTAAEVFELDILSHCVTLGIKAPQARGILQTHARMMTTFVGLVHVSLRHPLRVQDLPFRYRLVDQ
jgi:hypothetical protein